jgi:hypothetical protein
VCLPRMAAFCGSGSVRSSCVCPAKGGVDTVHTLSTTGFSTRILIPSSWLCLHYFMRFSVSGDMTLRPRSSVSYEVSGSAGTFLGYQRLWRSTRRQSAGVWDPDSSSGQPWFG